MLFWRSDVVWFQGLQGGLERTSGQQRSSKPLSLRLWLLATHEGVSVQCVLAPADALVGDGALAVALLEKCGNGTHISWRP